MTRLRQLMIEELQRRNFAETTIRSYVHGVEHFSRYFHRRPDQLDTQLWQIGDSGTGVCFGVGQA